MKFNTQNLNPYTRFQIEEGENGAWIELRIANGKAMREISKKVTKKVLRKNVFVEEINNDLMQEELWDYAIGAWGNIFDEDGSLISCTREMKVKLILENVEFQTVIASCIEKLNSEKTEKQGFLTKNF